MEPGRTLSSKKLDLLDEAPSVSRKYAITGVRVSGAGRESEMGRVLWPVWKWVL